MCFCVPSASSVIQSIKSMAGLSTQPEFSPSSGAFRSNLVTGSQRPVTRVMVGYRLPVTSRSETAEAAITRACICSCICLLLATRVASAMDGFTVINALTFNLHAFTTGRLSESHKSASYVLSAKLLATHLLPPFFCLLFSRQHSITYSCALRKEFGSFLVV